MSTAFRPILGRAETLLPKEKRFFLEHWGKVLPEEDEKHYKEPR